MKNNIQRRVLDRAEVYARRIHPEVELPKDVPGRIREAQVYLKLSADSQGPRRSKEHGLSLSPCQRRASLECQQGRRDDVRQRSGNRCAVWILKIQGQRWSAWPWQNLNCTYFRILYDVGKLYSQLAVAYLNFRPFYQCCIGPGFSKDVEILKNRAPLHLHVEDSRTNLIEGIINLRE